MTTTTTARTRRATERIWIGPGAVHQTGGALPLYICNACEAEVVWAESKTGRKYLANVSRGYMQQRFYIGRNVHDAANCAARVADHARVLLQIRREEWTRQGLCRDCGDEVAFDTRLGEPYFRCMDCIMDLRREADELVAAEA